MHLNRRALAGSALLAGVTAAIANADEGVLNDPSRNLETYIRMRGDISGAIAIERVDARVFGVVEKQLPRALHAAIGIQVSRFRKIEDGYAFKFKYFSMPTDLITGAPITHLDNPYTGKRNEIPARLGDNPEIHLTTKGWRFPNRAIDPATQNMPGIVRPWQIVEDRLILTDTLVSPPRYERHPAFQLFTYSARARDALNTRRATVASTFAGTGMEDWRDWMEIKDIDGSLCVHTFGHKVKSARAFPAWLVEAGLRQDASLFSID